MTLNQWKYKHKVFSINNDHMKFYIYSMSSKAKEEMWQLSDYTPVIHFDGIITMHQRIIQLAS